MNLAKEEGGAAALPIGDEDAVKAERFGIMLNDIDLRLTAFAGEDERSLPMLLLGDALGDEVGSEECESGLVPGFEVAEETLMREGGSSMYSIAAETPGLGRNCEVLCSVLVLMGIGAGADGTVSGLSERLSA